MTAETKRLAASGLLVLAAACVANRSPTVGDARAAAVAASPSSNRSPQERPTTAPIVSKTKPSAESRPNLPVVEETLPPKRPLEPPVDLGLQGDPAALARLSALTDMPKRFVSARDKRYAKARQLLERVRQSLRNGSWRELKGTRCAEKPGSVITSGGAAIVVDGKHNVKALTILGGTEDHFHELRSYFDDSGRARFLFIKYADVHGGVAEHIVYFSANGAVGACDNLQLGEVETGWDLCVDETLPLNVDPEVERAMQTQERQVPRNQLRDTLQTLDPRRVYEECASEGDLEVPARPRTSRPSSTEQKCPLPSGKNECCAAGNTRTPILSGATKLREYRER